MKFKVYHREELASLFDKDAGKDFPEGYSLAASVECDNIDEVFRVTNHIDESWTENPEVKELHDPRPRSTSVGDVVVSEDENNQAYLCAGMGWEKI